MTTREVKHAIRMREWSQIIGTKKALSMAVRNVTVNKRNTMLAERLHGNAAK